MSRTLPSWGIAGRSALAHAPLPGLVVERRADCYTFPSAHLDTKVHFDPSQYMGGLLGRASQTSKHIWDVSSFRVLGTNEPASELVRDQTKRARRSVPFSLSGEKLVSYLLGIPEVAACDTSSMRVPLSRCTFLPAEVISDPCALPVSAALRLRPFMPKTPRLLEASCPAEFNPPAVAPLAPTVVRAAVLTALSARLPVPATVLVTDPVAPPAVETKPP